MSQKYNYLGRFSENIVKCLVSKKCCQMGPTGPNQRLGPTGTNKLMGPTGCCNAPALRQNRGVAFVQAFAMPQPCSFLSRSLFLIVCAMPQPCSRLMRCFFDCFCNALALFKTGVLVFLRFCAMPQPALRLGRWFLL